MKTELRKAHEEISYRKYPEDLLILRNKLIASNSLDELKDKLDIELPEGMKGVTEAAGYVVDRFLHHFGELKNALAQNDANLAERIKNHLLQMMSLVVKIPEFRPKETDIQNKCKIINLCILTVSVFSKQCNSAGIHNKYLYYISYITIAMNC